jgi:hypothetical protein
MLPLMDGDACIDTGVEMIDVKSLTYAEQNGKIGVNAPTSEGSRKKLEFKPYTLADAIAHLEPNSYSDAFKRIHPNEVRQADAIHDILYNRLRDNKALTASELHAYLMEQPRAKKLPEWLPDVCIRSAVAEGRFVRFGNSRSRPKYRLSDTQLANEKHREFAGTFAAELSALSERIRLLIGHPTEVGSYREGLLQNLLRKHLPERYHVATGFIHNCKKQIDILIYDRIEYPPLFREGDLVVVPAESVRAVIEVKTSLDKDQLMDSLEAMALVSPHDDCYPPFFKGIFAYESLDEITLERHIADFYSNHPITYPYRHLSSLCVLGKSYMQVIQYRKTENDPFTPKLRRYKSETGLAIQATLFLDALLTYLRLDALKTVPHRQLVRLLRTDSRWRNVKQLPAGTVYAADAPGRKQMEEAIVQIDKWLNGEPIEFN